MINVFTAVFLWMKCMYAFITISNWNIFLRNIPVRVRHCSWYNSLFLHSFTTFRTFRTSQFLYIQECDLKWVLHFLAVSYQGFRRLFKPAKSKSSNGAHPVRWERATFWSSWTYVGSFASIERDFVSACERSIWVVYEKGKLFCPSVA